MAKTTDIVSPVMVSPDSAQAKLSSRAKTRVNPPSKKPKWRIWIFRILFIAILLMLIGGAYLWVNRYAFIENLAADNLAKHGFETKMDIQSLTKTHAVLKNVKITHQSKTVFSAGRIEAEYDWREAMKGQLKSAALTQARAHITIDKTGKIIDAWLPQPQDKDKSSTPLIFPQNGISLKDGTLIVQSPYGEAELSGDVDLQTPKIFTAKLTLAPTQLRYNELAVSGGGLINIDTSGADIDAGFAKIDTQLSLSKLSHPAIDVNTLGLDLNGIVNITETSFDGRANIGFSAVETAQVFLGQSQINWEGQFKKTAQLFDLNGIWSAKLNQARIPDPARSEALANTLSFHAPLSKSPIAQNFIPELKDILHSLMTGSDITARGDILRNGSGVTLRLSAPAQLKSAATRLTLTPHETLPTYYFDREAHSIEAALDANFTAPASLSLKGLNFKAQSFNGVRIDKVEDFSARIHTAMTWSNYGLDGRPVRLSPLALNMRYDGKNTDKRIVNISGKIDYDGVLPGAYVKGLKTAGDMAVTLAGKDLIIGYQPKAGVRLHIDKVETAADWTAYAVDANISPSKTIFERRGTGGDSDIKLGLSAVSFDLRRTEPTATLKINAETLTAQGVLAPSKNAKENRSEVKLTQDWDVNFEDARVTSDDLPGPDTLITLPNGHLKAALATHQAPYFDLTAPSAHIQTQLINAEDMRLRVFGRADNYDIEHSGGRVKLEGNTLPPLPIDGQLNVTGGSFIGTANARLPQADNTPIAMSYNIRDGEGYADVDIDMLEFIPSGLQPQSLISALRGKIAQVEGRASAKIHLDFARGEPLQSSGTAKIINMNLGTAPGPIMGMNMELTMDSVLPLISRGRQRITMTQFDPGIPLLDGIIDFELVDDGVKIYSAKWPIEHGFFSLDPFTWKYGAEENRLTLRLSDVELSEFMESMGNDSIDATGQLQGEFPIVISGVNLLVENGHLTIKDGGTIRYNPASADGSPPISYTQEEAIKILRTKDQARYSSLARDALREFKYKELSVKINGPLDGEVELETVFNGSNPKVLNGQPFEFDINVVGELFNIIRSFDSNAQIKSELAKQGISLDGLSIDPE